MSIVKTIKKWFSFEPEPKRVVTVTVNKHPRDTSKGAVEQNKDFIHESWDEYPEYVKEHIKRYDAIDSAEDELESLGRVMRYLLSSIEEYLELAKDAERADIPVPGIQKIVTDLDSRISETNAKIRAVPDISGFRKINADIEKLALEEGWVCWYGTGGLHWNKKGVVEDGYGVYER